MYKKHPKIKKNDKVMVVAGREKGKIGAVLKVNGEKQQVIIEKVNLVKRHTRASAKNAQGGIVEKEAPVHLSNVMLVCSKCAEPTRIGNRLLEKGKKVRTCQKCGEILDQ